jgi:hypothetical protein
MLFHISEEPRILRFEPRPNAEGTDPVVWAVDESRLRNYLLPRDCPRVTFYAGAKATDADRERFLGESEAVVAIESGWLDRVRSARLYCYAMPPETFACTDANAGYYQSQVAVTPTEVTVIDDLLGALASRGVEIRIMTSLWDLHDAVAASTLCYSIIRMRNATPRPMSPALSPSPSGRGLG